MIILVLDIAVEICDLAGVIDNSGSDTRRDALTTPTVTATICLVRRSAAARVA